MSERRHIDPDAPRLWDAHVMRTKTLICLAGAFVGGALARDIELPVSNAAAAEQRTQVTAVLVKGTQAYMNARGPETSAGHFALKIDLLRAVQDGTYRMQLRMTPPGGTMVKRDYALTIREL
jgi:hypothetical protein